MNRYKLIGFRQISTKNRGYNYRYKIFEKTLPRKLYDSEIFIKFMKFIEDGFNNIFESIASIKNMQNYNDKTGDSIEESGIKITKDVNIRKHYKPIIIGPTSSVGSATINIRKLSQGDILYTTDGSDPDENSPSGDTITIYEDSTIKAIVVGNGMIRSDISEAQFVVQP